MARREWKPGDVAHVPGVGRALLADDGAWVTQRIGKRHDAETFGRFTSVRPLAVIDPEDREQVERLTDLLWETCDDATAQTDMQAALREFANPTPQIEEPTGLGAVVEDEDGDHWIRGSHPTEPWFSPNGSQDNGTWADINAVRVLSKGVTP
jgi:hypothetical protein